jgi:hypothetical protein
MDRMPISSAAHMTDEGDRRARQSPLLGRVGVPLPLPAPRGRHGESLWPKGRAAPHLLASALLLAAAAGCASSGGARYVQYRELQAGLNNRAAEALEAGLIDAAMAKRILAISEAVSREAERYRAALASGSPPSAARAILDVIARLLSKAEIFLPDAELMR